MKLYAEREGNAECGQVLFDEYSGIKISIRMQDGEAIVTIGGIEQSFIVVEGLPLTLTVYQEPVD